MQLISFFTAPFRSISNHSKETSTNQIAKKVKKAKTFQTSEIQLGLYNEAIKHISFHLTTVDLVHLSQSCKQLQLAVKANPKFAYLQIILSLAQKRFGKTTVAELKAREYAALTSEELFKTLTKKERFKIFEAAIDKDCDVMGYELIQNTYGLFHQRNYCDQWSENDHRKYLRLLEKLWYSGKSDLLKTIVSEGPQFRCMRKTFLNYPEEFFMIIFKKIIKKNTDNVILENAINKKFSLENIQILLEYGLYPGKEICELANGHKELSLLLSRYV